MISFVLPLLSLFLSIPTTHVVQAFVPTPIMYYKRGTTTTTSTTTSSSSITTSSSTSTSSSSSSSSIAQERPRIFVQSLLLLSTSQAYNSPSSAGDTPSSRRLDWKPVVEAVFERDKRPIILFDGVCNLCNGGVNFALDNDKQGNFRFASLQSNIGQSLLVSAGRRPNDMSSIVLVRSNGRAYFESDAILRISAGLDGGLFAGIGTVGKFVPRLLRDALYHVVSENRHLLGESDQCRLDFDGEFDDRFMVEDEEAL